MADERRNEWRNYSKSGSLGRADSGGLRYRLKAVQEQARKALRKTRSEGRSACTFLVRTSKTCFFVGVSCMEMSVYIKR